MWPKYTSYHDAVMIARRTHCIKVVYIYTTLDSRFYLLPKIHKRLHDVPGRPVISNCGFYTENISSFLDHHLQPLAQRVKSYIKDTNHFLNKIKKIGKLPEGAILCTMDVVGLYPNIPHGEGLASLYKFLETRENKQISSDTLAELAETDYIRDP